jgi:hypothetical protein
MRLVLTIVAMALNLLCAALILFTISAIRMSAGGQIACWAFLGLLCLNAVAILFGARLGSSRPDRQQMVSTFD